jgi:SAM-dependent methyltransferase
MMRAIKERLLGAVAARAGKLNEPPLFPRLTTTARALEGLSRKIWEPAARPANQRIRNLEAKVEYLLDELYRLKSIQRMMPGAGDAPTHLRAYQLATFDFQWGDIVYHDEFLSNPAWRGQAPHDAAQRSGVEPDWFRGKKVLDCGCGPGRHAWALASLGATVIGFDMADHALAAARQATADFGTVTIEKHSILDRLPYPADFDMVWCYGVLHHTGDTLRALRNIARHVRPGGRIYLMLYAEPRRDNIFDYQYQHEIATLREATRHLSFAEKAKVFSQIEGEGQTLAWFDAISSEINDLYTYEEIEAHLHGLGFDDIRRTMPAETMHNIVATRTSQINK